MNPDVKQKWIAALRSGDYKQTREQLRRRNSYCCLGVLTDLYDKNKVESKDCWCGNSYSYTNGEAKCKANLLLPPPVMEWAGLEASNPNVEYPTRIGWTDTPDQCNKMSLEPDFASLAYLNDSEKLNFNQIADIIEEQC
jgi:hypothetical protein